MSGSAVYSFADASLFEHVLRAANVKTAPTERGLFRAELMQIDFERLWLQSD